MAAPGKQELIELLEPSLKALGFELVDLDVRVGRNGLLRLYIDKADGVMLADCEFVSKQIGALLDVEDPLPGAYTLEVSSPGLDRRLRTPEHFERFSGDRVRIELKRAVSGRKRFKGVLLGIDEHDTIAVEVDGEKWALNLADVAMARLVPQL